MINTAKAIIVGSGVILGLCVAVVAINIMSMNRCNDFLNNTYRVGHYEFFSGSCFIKTNSGKLVKWEEVNKKIVSVY